MSDKPKASRPYLAIPKWICVGVIVLASAALIVQAVIDVHQGTRDISLFSTEWLAQAWQMALVTGFIMSFAAIGGCFLNVRAWGRAALLYLLVLAFMGVTITNSIDFLADNTLATGEANRARAVQTSDIASIRNNLAISERKEMLENQWRTYYSSKTPTERAAALAQIQATSKEGPTLVVPEVQPVKAGGGSIWHLWFGWRPDAVREAKAVAIPVLIMIGKALGITIGFACWPRIPPPQDPTTGIAQFSNGKMENSKSYTEDQAVEDLAGLVRAGFDIDKHGAFSYLARRWGWPPNTTGRWLRRQTDIKLALPTRRRKPVQSVDNSAPTLNGNGRAHVA